MRPGCGQKVNGTRCDAHGGAREVLRPTASQRGYGRLWRKYREAFLARPENASCRGVSCTKKPTHVDHIQAVDGPNDARFWDPTNHQPLCASCHARKTNAVDGGWGNPVSATQ